MAITFVNAGTEGAVSVSPVTLGAPASPQNGDIWIAVIHSSDNAAISFTDWTEIVQANGGGTDSRLSVWWFRYAGSTPNLDATRPGGSGDTFIGGIAAFRGCKASGSPVNVAGTIGTGTDASIEHGAISPAAGCALLAINGAADDNNRTALGTVGSYTFSVAFEDTAGGTQNSYQSNIGTVDGSIALEYALNVPAGSTGTITQTQAAADQWAAVLIALEPEPTAHSGQGTFNGASTESSRALSNSLGVPSTYAGASTLSVEGTVVSAPYTVEDEGGISAGAISSHPVSGDVIEAAEAEAHVGEVRFAGAGDMSVTARLVEIASATFAGSGTFSIEARKDIRGAVSFAGASTMSVAARLAQRAEVRFDGAGSMSAQAEKLKLIEARFSGAGSLSVEARQNSIAAINFAGAGALSATGVVNARIAATFAGAGSLSAQIINQKLVEARFDGAGSFSALARLREIAAVSFAGSGSLSATANLRMVIQARFDGAGSLATDATIAGAPIVGEATLQGTGDMSVALRQNMAALSAFAGAGTLSAATVQRMVAAASFAGASTLSAHVRQAHIAQVSFAGAGSLSVNATRRVPAQATFEGAGSLSATVRQNARAATTFAGSGVLSITATLAERAFLEAFDGTGALSAATVAQMIARAQTFAGSGALSTLARQNHLVSAVFAGSGTLSAEGTVGGVQIGEATFNGTGSFSIAVRARYAANIQFTGTGNMLVTVRQIHRVAAIFAGAGAASWQVQHPGGQEHVIEAIFAGAGDMLAQEGALPQVYVIEAHFAGEGTLRNTKLMYGDKALVYDFPIGRSLKSDYGIRGSIRRGGGRLVIGRR